MNAYVLDPAHIAPSRSDATSNGHFPSNHMPAGTPRGFTLANMPMGFGNSGAMPPGAGFQGGLPSSAPGFPGFMNAANAGNWAPNGVSMNGSLDPSGLHNPGVMRKMGGRYGNRTGPYDRRGGGRFGMGGGPGGAGNGRLSPVRGGMFGGGGRMHPGAGGAYIPPGHPAAGAFHGGNLLGGPFGGSGGRWGDGAGGGQQAMGPREAVQGRSLKSYEDLDAVGGAGDGELNY